MTMHVNGSDEWAFLEDETDHRTVEWSALQAAAARAYLDRLPHREALMRRLRGRRSSPKVGVPIECGEHIFYRFQGGSDEQARLCTRGPDGRQRSLFDPLERDPRGAVSLDAYFPSADGSLVAFAVSTQGDERSVLNVLSSADGRVLPEQIPDVRYSYVSWFPGSRAFVYTRFPAGAASMSVHIHRIGTDPIFDERVDLSESIGPFHTAVVSADGRHVSIVNYEGRVRSNVYLAAADGDKLRPPEKLATKPDALYHVIPGNRGAYVRTNEVRPSFELFEVPYDHPARNSWVRVSPARDGILAWNCLTQHGHVLCYADVGGFELILVRFDGLTSSLGTWTGHGFGAFTSSEDHERVYIAHGSYFRPPEITIAEITSSSIGVSSFLGGESGQGSRSEPSPKYKCEVRWFRGKDDVEVPLTLLWNASFPPSPERSAVVYAYGGFGISLTPAYASAVLPWLDAGGIYCIVHARGGGEFGEAWHNAAIKERKQTTFDDVIAGIEFLSRAGLAHPRRVGLMGGSNGGLLVAAVLTQRPDLLGAAVCVSPVTDMLRFDAALLGSSWIPEYGDPKVPSQARYLRAYSPYHNIKPGCPYPPLLVSVGQEDTRVSNMHARKFVARLQASTSSDSPSLLSIAASAGHGPGRARSSALVETIDRWSFLFYALLDASRS